MKKWILLLAICFCNLSFATPIQDHKIDPKALSNLASTLDLPQDSDIISATQKHWLRKAGQERWELAELSAEKKLFVLDWAEKQGLFKSWEPSQKSYHNALILGATTPRMQMRLDYLKELWLQGLRFNEIVWLTGDRPLDKRVDSLIDRCNTEAEAARILWEETDLPEDMRRVPVIFIAVPMKIEGSSLKRPNTEDTIVAWLETIPHPCSALFISDQPFCGYQFAVIKTSLPDSVQFDVAGQGIEPTKYPTAANILDSIARWLYQENLYQSRN